MDIKVIAIIFPFLELVVDYFQGFLKFTKHIKQDQ